MPKPTMHGLMHIAPAIFMGALNHLIHNARHPLSPCRRPAPTNCWFRRRNRTLLRQGDSSASRPRQAGRGNGSC